MFRAIASVYVEGRAQIRRDGIKILRVCNYCSTKGGEQTVVCDREPRVAAPALLPPPPPASPAPPAPPPPRRPWAALAALAVTASLGGVYFYRKLNDAEREEAVSETTAGAAAALEAGATRAEELPAHAQYLLVGGGTAAFAAMRAIRAARPDAQVLIVGEELAPPYMRPPLSKELWREPELAERAAAADAPSFRQWNGRRRALAYEPAAFYAGGERMRSGAPGAALARGWRVVALDPERRAAVLAAGELRHELTYGEALLATGSRPRRVGALREAAAAGRSLAVRSLRDVARVARALDEPACRTVAVLGDGFLATELAAALAERLRGRRVVLLCREEAPLAGVLPPYLAREAATRLLEAGVELVPRAEVAAASAPAAGGVRLTLADGGALAADLVLECVGAEPAAELARGAGLELAQGGVLVNAELQARAHLWAAGDVASFYDEALGRRRVEHHDHAVLSGRLAGENMTTDSPRAYRHRSMFWSELGATLGYEAVGVIDSRLPTLGVFSADAVAGEERAAGAGDGEGEVAAEGEGEAPRRYRRGVVLYVRERRVVGVLLWNLFERMHVARQVVGEHFEDLFEVAKLFAPQEE